MSSHKKRDKSLDGSASKYDNETPEKSAKETLFQFFKKKTKYNLDKNYTQALRNSKRAVSAQPLEDEPSKGNLSFLKKLNDSISPKKKSSRSNYINNFNSIPGSTIDLQNQSIESGYSNTKRADERRFSSFLQGENGGRDEDVIAVVEAFNKTPGSRSNTGNPLKSSLRKVQFTTNESRFLSTDNNQDQPMPEYNDLDEEVGTVTEVYEATQRTQQIAQVQKRLSQQCG
jgi:hypothetical protein